MTEKEKKIEITHKSQLIDYFEQGNKPPEKWGIGTENEKFLFRRKDFKRLRFDQDGGILKILNQMQKDGWQPILENNITIGLRKNGASITLEPGGQFELSGDNFETIHQTYRETRKHFQELNTISKQSDFFSLPMGVDPLSNVADVPWVPKERYRWMRDYMPKKGELGLHMMTNTASTQVNLDYGNERDMVKKMRVAQALQAVVTAIFANSPFSGGKPNGYLTSRLHIWNNTDPDRCGFLPFIFDEGFGFERWVDYLLDIPMYYIYRDEKYSSANGLTFREFFEGKHSIKPTQEDWEMHVSTIFPDVRLKQFIEMRGADASCVSHIAAVSALWVGLLYDGQSLDEASELISKWDVNIMQNLRAQVPVKALNATSGDLNVGAIAKQIFRIASDGLARRAKIRCSEDESRFLAPVREITESGITVAEKLLKRYHENNETLPELVYNWQNEQMQKYVDL
ncbi:glutamate--cysteine ligase [Draconibacterium halophilum]|uniref:Glutamate--cysteine ligase n=1 Tax=Draconibacterium halophilum TaxID=2706887 RepID=A0A6C0RI50_9BACT|nr:glutamate--cysteine ligase [Draconibacterium halophilum]QIA09335.1 glutamate--cysteine ligase [Draconibacterium halophilum]